MSARAAAGVAAGLPTGIKTPTLRSSSPAGYPSSPTRPSSVYRPSSPTRSSSSLGSHADKVAVNVAVRIRPSLDDVSSATQSSSPVRRNVAASIVEESTSNSVTISRKKFQFDNVFDESTTQQGVWNYVGNCVSKFVQGYNVTIMAYGQSGSGKSYTMGTGDDSRTETDTMGVTQRAARQVFAELNRGRAMSPDFSSSDGRASPVQLSMPRIRPPSMNFSVKNRLMDGVLSNNKLLLDVDLDSQPWTVSVSFMEIYNEQLQDLLDPTNAHKKMTIREDVKGNIIVQGIKEVIVADAESLMAALEQGSRARQTNSTAINAQSSRSHAIFSIHLTQKQLNPESGIITTITSKLNLVDLAGSERLKNTGANTEGRVREGISINSGLTSLGKVISQLSLNPGSGGHISYRDSKLTRALQDSLGGKAITYLIACITTESAYISETLNTLSYAQRARSIQSTPEIQTAEASREALLRTVAMLQAELAQYKSGGSPTSTPVQPGIAMFGGMTSPMSPQSSESSRDRVSRSTAFQSAVESIISDYEATIKSLQESSRVTRENNTELLDTLEQVRAELREAQEANEELGDLVEQLQARLVAAAEPPAAKVETVEKSSSEEDEKDEAKQKELKIAQLERELISYRLEQKRHSSESQYLTSQYNNSRRDVERLTKEKEDLELKLRRLELQSQPAPHLFRRRTSIQEVAEEDEDTNSTGSSEGNDSILGPETPPSLKHHHHHQHHQIHQDFQLDTRHRRTLSLASSSTTSSSAEKTPREERRRSSFFVRASVM